MFWPLLDVAPVAEHPPDLTGIDALLATSAHGVATFADLSDRRDLPLLSVGDATAHEARTRGFATVQSAGGDAAALAALARAAPYRRYLYVRGQDISTDLAGLIGRQRVAEAVLYAARPGGAPPPDVAAALASRRITLITIWSERNAQTLARHLAQQPSWDLGRTDLLAISTKAIGPLATCPFRRQIVTETPSTGAMLEGVRRIVCE